MMPDSQEIFFKLVFAHLIGDFVLQTGKWVAQKEQKSWRAPLLYAHALIHGLLVWAMVWQFRFWPFAAAIAGSHFLIDLLKITVQNRWPRHTKLWFAADQVLHLLVLGVATVLYSQVSIWQQLRQVELPWRHITAYLFVTKPAAIVIRVLISHWKPNPLLHLSPTETNPAEAKTTLADAGMWIGMIERLLVLTFILISHWEAIGFLLAAKSVFRFGDLRGKHDMQLTEYILIGTLMSFGIAILTGLLTVW
ncbi:DUF3307 domain-containing protein [Pontibacter sp. CAU 1760]